MQYRAGRRRLGVVEIRVERQGNEREEARKKKKDGKRKGMEKEEEKVQ